MKIQNGVTQVWSSGGGTQSAAVAALIVRGDVPRPDIAVIADTGREKQSTWDYMSSVIEPAMDAIGVKVYRISKTAFATCDLFSINRNHVLLPAFTNQSGEVSSLTNFCTNEWKVRVIDRWLKKVMSVIKYQR